MKLALFAVGAIIALTGAACGSPLSTADQTQTAASGTAAPNATGTPAPSSIDATTTALFDATNRKFVAIGRATLPPGTDPLNPLASITYPPVATVPPGPSPTPIAPTCGATIAGWPEILAAYGKLNEKGSCAPFTTTIGTQLVIWTQGVNGGPGAIATYLCQPTDTTCLHGGPPQASGAAWSVYPAPYPGGVNEQAVGDSSPDVLILGQACFNLSSHEYLSTGCH